MVQTKYQSMRLKRYRRAKIHQTEQLKTVPTIPDGMFRFGFDECQAVARRIYPSAPTFWTIKIGSQVAQKLWDAETSIFTAIRNTGVAVIRHGLTDYDSLLKLGEAERDEARKVVVSEVTRIYKEWTKVE